MLAMAAVLKVLLDITPMIKTNIWVFWSFYIIYALLSVPLFLSTSGGWLSIFFYLIFASFYYIVSSVLLFLSADCPLAVFAYPEVLKKRAVKPVAVFPFPVVLE